MYYTIEGRIRYSEIDHHGTVTLPGIINYFRTAVRSSRKTSARGGLSLLKKKRAWILSYWQVIVDRYPKMGEKITVGTFSSGFQGLFGKRNFVMKDERGQQVACAHSLWVYLDVESGRPVRPDQEEIDAYGEEPPLEMPYEGRKIVLPKETKDLPVFPVRKYHIDTNEHVNNCQYVQMALEVLPEEIQVHKLRVDYKKSAVLGDRIFPKYAKEEDRVVVELCDEGGKSLCGRGIRLTAASGSGYNEL